VQEVEADIVRACAAMPLALKLVGAELKNRDDPDFWHVSRAPHQPLAMSSF
jgi:hypothetical protein